MRITMDQFQLLVLLALERLEDPSHSDDEQQRVADKAMIPKVKKIWAQAESSLFVLATRKGFQGDVVNEEDSNVSQES
jgi:hypothetical protein